jgi:hypothetical protein
MKKRDQAPIEHPSQRGEPVQFIKWNDRKTFVWNECYVVLKTSTINCKAASSMRPTKCQQQAYASRGVTTTEAIKILNCKELTKQRKLKFDFLPKSKNAFEIETVMQP